jgi:hypothetical protein
VNAEFVFVDVPGIRWDAKYATWDNFTGKPVDGYLVNRIVGTKALVTALTMAHEKAESLGYGLLLWDGYRPQRAVDCFLRWAGQPEDGATKARYHPRITRAEMFELGYVANHGSLRVPPLRQRVVALHADRRALPGHLLRLPDRLSGCVTVRREVAP